MEAGEAAENMYNAMLKEKPMQFVFTMNVKAPKEQHILAIIIRTKGSTQSVREHIPVIFVSAVDQAERVERDTKLVPLEHLEVVAKMHKLLKIRCLKSQILQLTKTVSKSPFLTTQIMYPP